MKRILITLSSCLFFLNIYADVQGQIERIEQGLLRFGIYDVQMTAIDPSPGHGDAHWRLSIDDLGNYHIELQNYAMEFEGKMSVDIVEGNSLSIELRNHTGITNMDGLRLRHPDTTTVSILNIDKVEDFSSFQAKMVSPSGAIWDAEFIKAEQ